MSEFKTWPTLGYIKDSEDSSLDSYIKVNKDLTIKADGEVINATSIGMPKFLTAYDKNTKTEVIIGKLVKRREKFGDENSKLKVFISLEPNITFEHKGDKVSSSGLAFLETQQSQLDKLDKSLADNKITEEQFEKAKTNIGYSKAKVTLPPPRD